VPRLESLSFAARVSRHVLRGCVCNSSSVVAERESREKRERISRSAVKILGEREEREREERARARREIAVRLSI